MSGLLAALQWLISNWNLIATCFSSLASIVLFFMHGNAKQELQQLKDFVNSLQISQVTPAQAQKLEQDAALKNK